mgnify:CR=1 FL=1
MLLEKLQAASLDARKAQNTIAASLLTTLYSEAARVGKDQGNRVSTDEEVVAVVKKFSKNIDETLAALPEADARVAVLRIEKELLAAYLPQQLDEAGLSALVAELVGALADKSPKQMGVVMAGLKARAGGQYDGAMASRLVKAALA